MKECVHVLACIRLWRTFHCIVSLYNCTPGRKECFFHWIWMFLDAESISVAGQTIHPERISKNRQIKNGRQGHEHRMFQLNERFCWAKRDNSAAICRLGAHARTYCGCMSDSDACCFQLSTGVSVLSLTWQLWDNLFCWAVVSNFLTEYVS